MEGKRGHLLNLPVMLSGEETRHYPMMKKLQEKRGTCIFSSILSLPSPFPIENSDKGIKDLSWSVRWKRAIPSTALFWPFHALAISWLCLSLCLWDLCVMGKEVWWAGECLCQHSAFSSPFPPFFSFLFSILQTNTKNKHSLYILNQIVLSICQLILLFSSPL